MRSPLFKKLPSCLLGAIIAASTATSVPVNAIDGSPPGFFELEGNTREEGTRPGTDWGALYAGATPANLITFTGITADPAPASVYWKGGSKDIEDVTEWWHRDGSVPDKDDITNAYAAAYTNPTDVCVTGGTPGACAQGQTPVHRAGDLIIYFGLDRFDNSGDAFAGFWFFQGEVGLDSTRANRFSGEHVARRYDPLFPGDLTKSLPGDLLVLVEYPQASGAHPEIKVYEWDPNDLDGDGNAAPNLDLLITQSNAECDSAGNKLACAITNTTALTDPAEPAWPYTAKDGSHTLPFETFFEGGINVTRLLGSTPCFAAFLAETRASRSETATLKDFVIDDFPVCGIDVTKDCTADLNAAGDGVDVTFSGILDNTGGSSYIAYLKDDQAGSSIDRVCIDVGNDDTCANDPDVAGLVKQAADGSAYFPLAAGVVVRYEGSYDIAGLPNTFTVSDTVTALAFTKVEDVGTPAKAIVSDTDDADCQWSVNPDLTVTKECTIAFVNGDHAEVTITGSVTNSGDVALSNVTVSDSDFGALTFPTTLAVGASDTYLKTVTVPLASLAPSYLTSNGLTTVTLNHADTVTAEGDVLASDDSVLQSTDDAASDTCSQSFTRGISVLKDCDQVILEPDANGRLVVKVKVTATVTNTGDEDLQNIVLTDNPAVVFESYPSTLAGGQTPDASFTVNGYYYPTSAIDLTNLTSLSFPDEASVTASGVFSGVGGGQSSDTDDADCPLCPVPE